MATEKARKLLARLAATPDAAVPNLPFLQRALLLPLLSASSVLLRLRLPLLLPSSPLRPRRTLPVPVVSVGNLTWGGNGKTPMVDFLARRFHNIGISPLILTRGYAGGDESKMLRRRLADTTTKLGIGANRADVASSMLQKYGYVNPCDAFRREKLSSAPNRVVNSTSAKIGVAIMDDGMQHRSLLRDVEIVMVNGLTPWGNGHFIPRGPMREPLSALTRADILVIHHANLRGPTFSALCTARNERCRLLKHSWKILNVQSKIVARHVQCSLANWPRHIFLRLINHYRDCPLGCWMAWLCYVFPQSAAQMLS